MCQEYLGDFESSLVQLAAVNAKLERRIDLNIRHEESVSPCEPVLLVGLLIQAFSVIGYVGNEG
jgi:hypothetical protein